MQFLTPMGLTNAFGEHICLSAADNFHLSVQLALTLLQSAILHLQSKDSHPIINKVTMLLVTLPIL